MNLLPFVKIAADFFKDNQGKFSSKRLIKVTGFSGLAAAGITRLASVEGCSLAWSNDMTIGFGLIIIGCVISYLLASKEAKTKA